MGEEWLQTVGDLKAWLADHPEVDDNTPIILERDAEGNSYSPLSAIYPGWWAPESASSGTAYGDDDVVTPEQAAADESVRWHVEEGNLHQRTDADLRCLVLGPLN